MNKAVSPERLAGIPWASKTTLAFLFQRVSAFGPHDDKVWSSLVSRAVQISRSFTDKECALILNAISKSEMPKPAGLVKNIFEILPSLSPSPQNLALLFHAGAALKQKFPGSMHARLAEVAGQLDAQQVAMIAAALRQGHEHSDCQALADRITAVVDDLSSQGLVMVLGWLVSTSHVTRDTLVAISMRIASLAPEMDYRTACMALYSLVKLGDWPESRDAAQLVLERFSEPSVVSRASPVHLGIALSAAAQLPVDTSRLWTLYHSGIRQVQSSSDLVEIARLLGNRRVGVLEIYNLIFDRLNSVSATEAAVLAHAMGKAGITDGNIFRFLRRALEGTVSSLCGKEVFMTTCGFHKGGALRLDAFGEELRDRIGQLLVKGEIQRDSASYLVTHCLLPSGIACDVLVSIL